MLVISVKIAERSSPMSRSRSTSICSSVSVAPYGEVKLNMTKRLELRGETASTPPALTVRTVQEPPQKEPNS